MQATLSGIDECVDELLHGIYLSAWVRARVRVARRLVAGNTTATGFEAVLSG
jgi:hypothetical protein